MAITKRQRRWVHVRLSCGHEIDTSIQEKWSIPVFCDIHRTLHMVVATWHGARMFCVTCRRASSTLGFDAGERCEKRVQKHVNDYPGHKVKFFNRGILIYTASTSTRVQPELELDWTKDGAVQNVEVTYDPPPF